MRIGGHGRIARRSREVPVGRDEETGAVIKLRVFEGGLGLADDIRDEIPTPTPPRNGEPVMDERGRIQKKADGSPLLAMNTSDMGWLGSLKNIEHLRDVALVYHCLDKSEGGELEPGQVAFQASCSDFPSMKSFYCAIKKEMKEAGLNDAGFQALLSAVEELSAIGDDELEAAREELAKEDEEGNSSGPSPTGDSEPARISELIEASGQA